MNVICQHCKTRLTIPDHKVPTNEDATLKCPKCKGSVAIQSQKSDPILSENKSSVLTHTFEDQLSALVCIESNDLKKKVQPFLRQMGFNIEIAQDTRTALEKMEYHIYHLVLIDDNFDQQKGLSGIIARMNAIDMSLRRRICLILISKKFRTNDNMAALHTSVNNIIREEDIIHMDAFLLKVVAEHRQFYTVYSESLKQAGKA